MVPSGAEVENAISHNSMGKEHEPPQIILRRSRVKQHMIKQVIRQSVLVVILLFTVGCSTSFDVVPSVAMAGYEKSHESKVVTYHGTYWPCNDWSDDDQYQTPESSVGIHSVEAQSNFIQVLGTLLSLGIWAPCTLEYWWWVEEEDDPDSDHILPPENGGESSKEGPTS